MLSPPRCRGAAFLAEIRIAGALSLEIRAVSVWDED
jgi:hypothetical protein